MKIDLSGLAAIQGPLQVPADRSSTKSQSPVSAPATTDVSSDRTTFSSTSNASPAVASLVSQALATPAVRQDKIDALRQSIASGDYKVDADKIASALIGEGN